MKTRIVILAAAVFWGLVFVPLVFGLSLEELLESAQVSALKTGERPAETQFRNPVPRLIPRHEGVGRIVENVRRELDPGIMVETLYLYSKPAGSGRPEWTSAEQLALLNETLALSSLAGLEYYSATRGVMRIFYETSAVIDGPASKNPLPDPFYNALPSELAVYARQKDLTFGDNTYRYDYHVIPGALVFIQQNLTSMTAGIIPAVGRNKLRSAVAVIDAGDYLLVYAVSMARAAALPGLRDRIGNSFANRASAVLTWFSAQADKAFAR
ncbi:MAG: hypothetical protein LBS48_07130 [Treponema sp.]|jgi:hypothetical protein|nr:hypothetical protein [Treponema sp.]